MSDVARALLDDPEREPAPVARFLLQAAVLGDLMQRLPDRARETWANHAANAQPEGAGELLARLYKAHLGLN
jgi:hypothetical protein